jgi:hypothetical protein
MKGRNRAVKEGNLCPPLRMKGRNRAVKEGNLFRHLRGAVELMEYIFMVLLIVVVIIILVFFLTGWQITQLRAEQQKVKSDQVLALMKALLTSPLLTNSHGLFDYFKLEAASQIDICKSFEPIWGKWWANITIIGGKSWLLCPREGNFTGYAIPANVWLATAYVTKYGWTGKTELALLEVRIYD